MAGRERSWPLCYLGFMRWGGGTAQYEVRVPDAPGIEALGFEPSEAVANAAKAVAGWRRTRARKGLPLPEPTLFGKLVGGIGPEEVCVLVVLPAGACEELQQFERRS